ncbi:cysteine hydrolase family protein [Allomuricauda sp. d1]|uniref:cysteine hydrolase family protein n=1 Tax=Allomuricauda sp. d1 TaxID=3136725 RepID=UPI0031CFD260
MKKPALLLIDIQKGLDEWDFYGGHRNNPQAEENAARILEAFRENDFFIFHVRHSSKNPESPLHVSKPGFEIKDGVKPLSTEPLYTKNVNSAFIGTDLEADLMKDGIKMLIIVGLTTNHCISTSVRMAANLGFETILISDATAAFDMVGVDGTKFNAELMHQTALASLKDEFATIMDAKTILEELQKNLS